MFYPAYTILDTYIPRWKYVSTNDSAIWTINLSPCSQTCYHCAISSTVSLLLLLIIINLMFAIFFVLFLLLVSFHSSHIYFSVLRLWDAVHFWHVCMNLIFEKRFRLHRVSNIAFSPWYELFKFFKYILPQTILHL